MEIYIQFKIDFEDSDLNFETFERMLEQFLRNLFSHNWSPLLNIFLDSTLMEVLCLVKSLIFDTKGMKQLRVIRYSCKRLSHVKRSPLEVDGVRQGSYLTNVSSMPGRGSSSWATCIVSRNLIIVFLRRKKYKDLPRAEDWLTYTKYPQSTV